MRILVYATVEDATSKITDIDAVPCGGFSPQIDAFNAECKRMHDWVRTTFIGQDITCLQSHNCVVPSSWSAQIKDSAELLREAEDLADRVFCAGHGRLPCFAVVNTINIEAPDEAKLRELLGKKSDFHRQLADAIRRQAEPPKKKAEPPRVGTYWRGKLLDHIYVLVIGVEEHATGGYYLPLKHVGSESRPDFKARWTKHWANLWTRVYGSDVPGRPELALASIVFMEKGTLYATFGGNDPISVDQLSDSQILAIEREHKRDFPDVRNFLEAGRAMERERNPRKISKPSVLGAPYGEDKTEEKAVQLEAGADYYQQFLSSVDSIGVNELPPREGERYFSIVSGNVYLVIDTTRKPYSRDYYVTMERESDKHRTKFTFRNHAVWLAVWRPVDHNGEAREVVQVEVEALEDRKAAREAMQKKIGKAAHEVAAQLEEYMREVDEDGVLDDLVRIYDELHRRVPGWNNKSLHEPGRTEADLAIRAIRKMARDLNTARKNFDAVQALKDKLLEAREPDKSVLIEVCRDIYICGIRKIVTVVGTAEASATVTRLFGRNITLSGLSEKQLASLFEALIQEIPQASL